MESIHMVVENGVEETRIVYGQTLKDLVIEANNYIAGRYAWTRSLDNITDGVAMQVDIVADTPGYVTELVVGDSSANTIEDANRLFSNRPGHVMDVLRSGATTAMVLQLYPYKVVEPAGNIKPVHLGTVSVPATQEEIDAATAEIMAENNNQFEEPEKVDPVFGPGEGNQDSNETENPKLYRASEPDENPKPDSEQTKAPEAPKPEENKPTTQPGKVGMPSTGNLKTKKNESIPQE